MNIKIFNIEKFISIRTMNTIISSTIKVDITSNTSTIVSNIEKVISKMIINMIIFSKKKVDFTIEIVKNRNKIFIIIKLSKKTFTN